MKKNTRRKTYSIEGYRNNGDGSFTKERTQVYTNDIDKKLEEYKSLDDISFRELQTFKEPEELYNFQEHLNQKIGKRKLFGKR